MNTTNIGLARSIPAALLVALTTLIAAFFVPAAQAQKFPERPIRFIVPFPPAAATTSSRDAPKLGEFSASRW